jgi:hypothetical protein
MLHDAPAFDRQVPFDKRYTREDGVEYLLRYPSSFSHRTQPSEDQSAWYLPVEGTTDTWLAAWLVDV